jgi:hypothetical protein
MAYKNAYIDDNLEQEYEYLIHMIIKESLNDNNINNNPNNQELNLAIEESMYTNKESQENIIKQNDLFVNSMVDKVIRLKQDNLKIDESDNLKENKSDNNIIINKYPTREELRNLRLKKLNNLTS